MYEDRELRKEERREQALTRLGERNRRCGICGEGDPRCLERHHTAGQKNSDDTVCVCRNCHRKLSDDQRDHPTDASGIDPLALQTIRQLLGQADLARAQADQNEHLAKRLYQEALTKKDASNDN